jgi:hypothetical protein
MSESMTDRGVLRQHLRGPAYVGAHGLPSCLYACRAGEGFRAAYLGATGATMGRAGAPPAYLGACCALARLAGPGLVGRAGLEVGAHGLRVPEETQAEGAEGSPRGPARAHVEALAEARLRSGAPRGPCRLRQRR